MAIFTSRETPIRVGEFWKQLSPPIRPSRLALQVYRLHLRRAKNRGENSVLVLGATPELRLLALREGFKVVFVDRDRLMIQAMALLMDYSGVDESLEAFLECDWLEMPNPPFPYGVVLGDGSLNHLTMEQMSELSARLRRFLTTSGTLCLRVITYPKSRKQSSLARIFSKYRTSADGELNRMFRDLYMRLLFARRVYQKSTRTSSHLRFMNELRRACDSNRVTKEEFNIFAPLAGVEYAPTVPFREEFLHMLSGFRIERIHELEYREHLDLSRVYELTQLVPS